MINKYQDHVMEILRQRRNLEADDTSEDAIINRMPRRKALDELAAWELGYSGWGSWFINAVESCGGKVTWPVEGGS